MILVRGNGVLSGRAPRGIPAPSSVPNSTESASPPVSPTSREEQPWGPEGSGPRLGAGTLSPLRPTTLSSAAIAWGAGWGARGWLRGRVQGSARRKPAPLPRRHEGPGRPRLAPRPAQCPPGAPIQARRPVTLRSASPPEDGNKH